MTHPSGIPLFERFFRSVARIKVDKNDVRRLREFVDEQIDGIAIAGRDAAKWNGRDVIVPQDLPITKGVQERMREFDKLDEAQDIRNLLSQVVRRPPADVTFDEDTEQMLPELFGGLSIALARSFRLIDPTLENPSTQHWDRALTLFRLIF
jgi:replication initiation and membrane attachment protein DnaB